MTKLCASTLQKHANGLMKPFMDAIKLINVTTLTFICLFKAIIANEKNKIAFNYITADLEIRRITGQVKAVESREGSLDDHQNNSQEMGYD